MARRALTGSRPFGARNRFPQEAFPGLRHSQPARLLIISQNGGRVRRKINGRQCHRSVLLAKTASATATTKATIEIAFFVASIAIIWRFS